MTAPEPAVGAGASVSRFFTPPVVVTSLVALAFLQRSWFAAGMLHKGDGVMSGLMAWDIARGEEFPLMYYGGPYAGTLESWLLAPLFMVTGPTWWGLSAVVVTLSALGVIPFYLLGARLGGRMAGYLSGLFWAFSPWAATFYNVTPRGCYPEIVAGTALLLWYGVRIAAGEKLDLRHAIIIGLLSGILVWLRTLIGPTLLTVALIVIWRDRLKVVNRFNLTALLSFFIGALPLLIHYRTAFGAEASGRIDFSELPLRLEKLAWIFVDGFMPFDPGWLAVAGKGSAWLMAALFFAAAIISAARAVGKNGDKAKAPFYPLILFVVIFLAVYLTNTASSVAQIRYILPLYTPLIAGSAVALAALWSIGLKPVAALLAAILLFVTSAVNVATFSSIEELDRPLKESLWPMVDWMEKRGVNRVVFNDYNHMERLAYEALVRGVDLGVMGYGGNLNRRWTEEVERDPKAGFLLRQGEEETARRWFADCCEGTFKVDRFDGFSLFYDVTMLRRPVRQLPATGWRITPSEAGRIIDRRHATTFYTSQSAEIVVDLGKIEKLARVRLVYGNRWPRTVAIDLSGDGATWREVAAPRAPSFFYPSGHKLFARLPWRLDREHEEWRFQPAPARYLKIRLGHDGSGDYDLHELFVYAVSREADPAPDPGTIAEAIANAGATRVIASRGMAALLRPYSAGRFKVSDLAFIESDPELATSGWRPVRGVAAVIGSADYDELAERLEKDKVSFSVKETGATKILIFENEKAPELWWTGFTLVSADPA